MRKPIRIIDDVFLIGSSEISNPEDCMVYLINCERELVLIDSGVSGDISILENNIRLLGFDPKLISSLILTHCHIDHIGGALSFKGQYGCKIFVHDSDAKPIELGDQKLTGAALYGIKLKPCNVDRKLSGVEGEVILGNKNFNWIHTPGHTPGSISILLKTKSGTVLFAQDVHGPFSKDFGSDIAKWRKSMEKILTLNFDILAEGHFGIFRPENKAKNYIREYLTIYG